MENKEPKTDKTGGRGCNFYDPNNNIWDFDKAKASNFFVSPTHNFELLRPYRTRMFEEIYKPKFLKEREAHYLETTAEELDGSYIFWLKSELEHIAKWLGNQKKAAVIIEINKYKSFVLSEVERIEKGGTEPAAPAKQIPTIAADTTPPAPESDLLDYDYPKDQIKVYFMQLTKFYTMEQVENFLKANFKGFAKEGEAVESICFPEIQGLKQGHIQRFFYDFCYYRGGKKELRKNYINIMIDNFKAFADTTFDTVDKSFSRSAPKNYPFSASNSC